MCIFKKIRLDGLCSLTRKKVLAINTTRWLRVAIAIVIIIITSVVLYFYESRWISFLYATVIALFPDEIKKVIKKTFTLKSNSRCRVVCAYLFRIMYANKFYLLVDERKENCYAPVGGVYKVDSNYDIGMSFEAEADGLHGINDDTENDLRLTISKRFKERFFNWFEQGTNREAFNDLTREFREEVLDTGLLPKEQFERLTYVYIGSKMEERVNDQLKLSEIAWHDIFSVQLTREQQSTLKKLSKTEPQNIPYVFATQEEIMNGSCFRAGKHHNISPVANLILVDHSSSLVRLDRLKGTFSPKIG